MTGLIVNRIYVFRHLKYYSKRDFMYKLSNDVEEFYKCKSYREYIKKKESGI